LADDVVNRGVYRWTIPATPTTQAYVKVEGTDTVVVFASDASDQTFTIIGAPAEEVAPCQDGVDQTPDDGDPAAACIPEGHPGSRTNPDTVLRAGLFVRTVSDTSVYYITPDLDREPV